MALLPVLAAQALQQVELPRVTQKFGFAVPELYWSGTDPAAIPFDRLPEQYVVRSVVGHSRRSVLVLVRGINLLKRERCDPARVIEVMRPNVRGLPRGRILVEAMVPPEPGLSIPLPRDYKFYVFGDRVGAIEVVERHVPVQIAVVDEDWNPLPRLARRHIPPDVLPPRPSCLDQLRATATTLGTAFGSFVRVDMYVGPDGAIFGEFAATPSRGEGLTEFADRHLGELWHQTFPDRI